jgi:hypothetical protein
MDNGLIRCDVVCCGVWCVGVDAQAETALATHDIQVSERTHAQSIH